MIRYRTYSSIVLIILSCSLQAQNLKKLYETAELLFYTDRFEEALYGYEEISQAQPDYQDVPYKLEICYLLTGDRARPLEKIQGYENSYGADDPYYQYWMGRIYANRYMYTDAQAAWDEFLGQDGEPSAEMQAEMQKLTSETEKKMGFLEQEEEYRISQLGGDINSVAADLSPVYNNRKKELLFTSSRGSDASTYKVFHAVQNGSSWGAVTEVVALGELTGDAPNIEVVNEDGKLFLFRSEKKGNLYYSENRNDNWVVPTEFDTELTSDDMSSHFFINEHEDRIIFATENKDRGLDLYETFRDANNGEWSKPAAFNSAVNSGEDDDSPYLTPDEKTLYFSSKGHGSIGGYDIFKSTYNDRTGTWSSPINMGYPINSPDDEVNFKMNPDGKTGYLSSNRLYTKGDFDIFYFEKIERIGMEGRVLAMGSGNPVSNAEIKFTARNFDGVFNAPVDGQGKYSSEVIANESYDVEITRNGETLLSDRFNIEKQADINTTYIKDFMVRVEEEEKESSTSTTDVVTTTIPTTTRPRVSGATTSNNVEGPTFNDGVIEGGSGTPYKSTFQQPVNYTVGPKAIAKNIYFQFGTAALRESAVPVLEEIYRLLSRNSGLTVEIGGHTDNIGSKETNRIISTNRALAVKGWLVRKGIADNRMYIRGYGEDQPLASNDDEIDGRELNRRIEIRVVN